MSLEIIYSPLTSSQSFKLTHDGSDVTVKSDRDQHLEASFTIQGAQLSLFLKKENAGTELKELADVALEYLFGAHSEVKTIALFQFPLTEKEILRSVFFQNTALWTYKKSEVLPPERWTETKGRAHPVRPRYAPGYLYRRHVPLIGKTLSMRLITLEDLDTFHDWHNQDRVAFFWELNKSKEELRDYIQNSLNDPHQFPIIIELDGERVGYFEYYWVAEDRLGPYYDSEAFDRGFHMLIGNASFLGYNNTDSIIKGTLHFLYLDDPRTRKVMAEPRHDNQKVLKYAAASVGWTNLKVFDFPHKRAVLLENRREVFFGSHAL